jgi:hypothetical protein
MVVEGLPKTREEAKALAVVAYFTGVPCKKGHTDKRYTNTGICYACKRQQAKRDYEEHPERIVANAYSWSSKNPNKCYEAKKKWRNANREVYRAMLRDVQKRKRLDPMFRLNQSTSKAISLGLRKEGRHWETLVSFTLDELKVHLERRFRDGMTWDNYGPHWELDHIKPRSKCESFHETWELNNLQPLLRFENRSKGNRKFWRVK